MPVEIIENLWIPLADGTKLAARLWRPHDAATNPVPAIMEYIPYRKRDGTRGRDEPMHGFFAAQGYAAIRVDMRGSGDSDGLLDDEYLLQEQDDAVEVITWLADQPWCSGAVGMMGKSWGGFNALQVAARRPPALKAIITVCSTDDRFADDIHYMGGCLLNDNLWWGAIMLAYQSRPPDPGIVGDGWRDQWLERLEHLPFWPALWMTHQSRDEYWKHGSVNEDFPAITCPVLAIGGWADAYTNAIPRLLAGLSCPRQGVIGPWAHIYPHDGVPGPAFDFLGEATRWWDTWLKGRDTGVMREPMLRAFIENYRTPVTTLPTASGRFVAESTWPSRDIAEEPWALSPGRLTDEGTADAVVHVRSPLWTGTAGGEWMGTGVAGEMAGDQRQDDGLSAVFDSEPLAADTDILGFPTVELELAADKPHAQLALRLCDVAPGGASLRVSYAVLNLDHRDGPANPVPLEPGKRYRVRVLLNACGHRFPAGHRLRLAVATSAWPLVWPARDAATLSVFTAESRLLLPIRPVVDEQAIVLRPSVPGPPCPRTLLREGRITRHVTFDQITGKASYTTVGEGGLFGEGVGLWDDIGTAVSHDLTRRLMIGADDPNSAESTIEQTYSMFRDDGWAVRIETQLVLRGDRETFHLSGALQAYERDTLITTRTWSETIPRVFV